MATYYVDGAVGSDSSPNDGLSEGAGNAWATIDHAMNNVVAGDHVYIKASATYSETATIDTTGSSGSPIIFEGYNSIPGDNGKVTISGGTNCINQSVGSVSTYYIFKNLILNGASVQGFKGDGTDFMAFFNCIFSNNGDHGCFGDNGYVFVHCEFYSNTKSGADVDDNAMFVGCKAYSNGWTQLSATHGYAYKNLIYGIPTNNSGIWISNSPTIIGNTIDGENTTGGYGINNQSTTGLFIGADNIIYDCDNGWLNGSGALTPVHRVTVNNLFNSNSGYNLGFASGMSDLGLDVTDAPAFTDEANDDYTLSDASPAIAAGIKPGNIT